MLYLDLEINLPNLPKTTIRGYMNSLVIRYEPCVIKGGIKVM